MPTLDRFGLPYFYPDKTGGFSYFQSNNVLNDANFNGVGDVTNNSGGGAGLWDCCKVAPSSIIVYDTDKVAVFYEGWNGVQEHIRHWRVGIARGQLDGSDQINSLTRDANNPYIGLSLSGSSDSVTSQLPSAIVNGSDMWVYYSGNDGVSFRVCLAKAPIINSTTMTLGTFVKHPTFTEILGHTEPDVVKDGSNWYMFYREETGSKPRIGVMTSSDGLTWADQGAKISPSSSGFDSAELVAPSAIKEGSTWYCFYETDDINNVGQRRIGYATASSPTGTWTKQGQALSYGGGWEGHIVGTPAIAKVDGKFYLFYHGFNSGKDQIGVAYSTSLNGPWTKEGSNPILVVGADDSSPTGEWTFSTDGPDSVQIFKNSDTASSIGGCDMNFAETADRGHAYKADDPRDIEVKFLVKFQSAGSDHGFAIEGPTGRHSEDQCCEGFAYKIDLDFQTDPPQWRFRKEMWHVSNHTDPVTGTWTTSLAPDPLLGTGKFYGLGYVRYNKANGGTRLDPDSNETITGDSVVLEAWFNPDPVANLQNWTMIKRTEDKGGWGNDGDVCNGLPDQIGSWSGSNVRIKSNVEGGEFIMKYLSMREIDPTKTFGDDPDNPTDPTDPSVIQGTFSFLWDINTNRTSECAGAGGGGGGGGSTEFYTQEDVSSQYALSDSGTHDNRTRVGEKCNTSSSLLFGKTLKQLDVQLRKVGSPGASPVVSAKIWNSSNAVVYTSPTTFDPSAFTTSFVEKVFDFSTNTHAIASGDYVGVEYTGTSNSNYVECGYIDANLFSNTYLVEWNDSSNSLDSHSSQEFSCVMWE